MNVLIIEEDATQAVDLQNILRKSGYNNSYIATTARDGIVQASSNEYGIILTANRFAEPVSNGIVKRLRIAQGQTPVIVIDTISDNNQEAQLLDDGANLVVRKPIHPALLMNRIGLVINSQQTVTSLFTNSAVKQLEEKDEVKILEWNDFQFDPAVHKCIVNGKVMKGREVQLTATEGLLLVDMMRNKGRIRTREQLMDVAYDEQVYVDDRTIDSHIKRLRIKLRAMEPENTSGIHGMVETLYGLGYRIDNPDYSPTKRHNGAQNSPSLEELALRARAAELEKQQRTLHAALGIPEGAGLDAILAALSNKQAQGGSFGNDNNSAERALNGDIIDATSGFNGSAEVKEGVYKDGVRMPHGAVFPIGEIIEINTSNNVAKNTYNGNSVNFHPVVGSLLEIMMYAAGEVFDNGSLQKVIFEKDNPANKVKLGMYMSQAQGVITQLTDREYASMVVRVLSNGNYGAADPERLLTAPSARPTGQSLTNGGG